jgi:excisionase family DNA binding protein
MENKFLSVGQVAKETSLCERSWRSFIAAGLLPHYRVGSRILLRWSDVCEFLERHRVDKKRSNNVQAEARNFSAELIGASDE